MKSAIDLLIPVIHYWFINTAHLNIAQKMLIVTKPKIKWKYEMKIAFHN